MRRSFRNTIEVIIHDGKIFPDIPPVMPHSPAAGDIELDEDDFSGLIADISFAAIGIIVLKNLIPCRFHIGLVGDFFQSNFQHLPNGLLVIVFVQEPAVTILHGTFCIGSLLIVYPDHATGKHSFCLSHGLIHRLENSREGRIGSAGGTACNQGNTGNQANQQETSIKKLESGGTHTFPQFCKGKNRKRQSCDKSYKRTGERHGNFNARIGQTGRFWNYPDQNPDRSQSADYRKCQVVKPFVFNSNIYNPACFRTGFEKFLFDFVYHFFPRKK